MENNSLENLIEEKMAENRKFQEKQEQNLNKYFQALERKIGSITLAEVNERIKEEINWVYGIDYNGELRYQEGDLHEFQLLGIDFRFPERLTFEEMTSELFDEPQYNKWQKIIRFLFVDRELTRRHIKEENLIKLPSLKLLFSKLKAMKFNPRIEVFLYRPGIQNKAKLKVLIECKKGKHYQELKKEG
ncbi:MAG: hypothetical protein AB4368_29740 [Xenococcaceae cyanobacterium]